MERKKKKENSGFYIALCCCAVIVAAVGYASRVSLEEEKDQEIVRVAEPTQVPEATAIPEAKKDMQKQPTKPPVNKEVSSKVVIDEPLHFDLPVEGKVIAEFSGDDLVYNEALKDWRAHSGVDFSGKMGEEVRASADGDVEDVFDSEMGRCIIISHRDGFKTMYANLNDDTTIKNGDKVSRGDIIGTIGNTALGDITEGEHLHFEIIKDRKNVNPVDYLD